MSHPAKLFRLSVVLSVVFMVGLASQSAQAATIKSVQRGSVTSTAFSGAGQIVNLPAAVDATKSFVTIMFSESDSQCANFPTATLSNTTLVLQNVGTANVTITWQVVEFLSGVSVQRGTQAFLATELTVPVTLPTAAPLGTSFAINTVRYAASPGSNAVDEENFVTSKLTTPTQLDLQRDRQGLAINVVWQVITFTDGTSTVQAGTTTMASGVSSATAPIAPAVSASKSFLIFNKRHSGTTGFDGHIWIKGALNAAGDTLTFDRATNSGACATYWYLITMPEITSRQQTTSIPQGATTSTPVATAFTPPVSLLTNSAIFTSTSGGSATAIVNESDDLLVTDALTSVSSITVNRPLNTTFSCAANSNTFIVEFAGPPVTTLIWNGSTSTSWNNAANWNIGGGAAGRVPQSGDSVMLTGAGSFRPTLMDIPSLSIGTLTFDSTTTTGITLAVGGTATNLTLTQALTVDAAAGNHTLNLPLVLAGPVTVTTGPAAGSLSIPGVISGTGSMTVAGAGTLNLNMLNTFTGGATLNAGNVPISAGSNGTAGPLGTSAGIIAFAGGTLTTQGATVLTLANPASVTGTANIAGTADLTFSSAAATSVASPTMNITNGTTIFTGAFTGTGPLIKNGAGTLRLNGVSGGLSIVGGQGEVINAGTLQYGVAQALPSIPITVNQGATLDFNNFNANVGNGKIILTGGTIKLGTAIITCQSLGTDGFTCTSAGGLKSQITGTAPGGINLGDSFRDFTINVGGTDPDLEVSCPVLTGNNTTNPILTKKGAGILVFSGNNTYTQPTAVTAGTMRVLGTYTPGAQVLTGSTLAVSGGTLVIGNSYTTPAAATLSGTGTIQLSGNGTFSALSLAISNDRTLLVDSTAAAANAFPNSLPVTMTGGTIEIDSPSGGSRNQTIGTITAGSGTNILKPVAVGAGGSATLAPTAVTVNGGTTQITSSGSVSPGTISLNNNSIFLIDTSATNATPLTGNPAINFNGGTLEIDAPAAGTRNTSVGTISITAGTNVLKLVSNSGTATVASNAAFSRSGGTLEFTTPGVTPPTGAKLTATGQAPGIVSFATVNGGPAQYDLVNGLVPATIPVFTTAQDGDWSVGTTWQGGVVPGANSNVVIQHAIVNNVLPTNNVNQIKFTASAAGSAGTGLSGTMAVNNGGGILVDAFAPPTLTVAAPLAQGVNVLSIDHQGAPGSTLTFTKAITGTAGISKLGTGKVVFTAASPALSGAIGMNSGIVETQVDTSVGSGPVTLQDATWQITTNDQNNASGITLGGTAPTIVTDKNLTCAGAVAGPASAKLTKAGNGRLVLAGLKTYAGGTQINAGTVESTIDGSTGTGGITISNATLAFTTNSQNLNASVVLAGTSATIDVATGLNLTQAATGTSLSNATANYVFNKAGGGTLILTEAGGQLRNFTGALAVVDILAGKIQSATGNVLGNQTINVRAGAVFDESFGDGEVFGFLTGAGTYINRTGAGNPGAGLQNTVAQTGTFDGLLTGGTSGVIGIDDPTRNTNVGLNVSSAAHVFTITNPLNEFAGQVQATGNSTIIFPNIANKGSHCALGDGNFNATLTPDISLGAGAGSAGTLSYTGPTASSDRTIVIANVGGGILDITNPATALTLSGVISQGTALSPLTKTGPGTLVLGAACTYTGPTTISAGSLQLTSAASLQSAVTVAAGTSLRGTGNVNGALTVNGLVWPGASSSVGTLSNDENLSAASANFSAGGKLNLLLRNSLSKKQSLSCTGTVTLGGSSVLSIAFDPPSVAPSQFSIVSSGAGGITQTFGSVLAGTMVYGVDYDIVYTDGTPNNTFASPAPGALPAAVNTIIVRFNKTNVTPVTVDSFDAAPDGAGVLVKWTSVSEYRNAGFHISRRELNSENWTRINPVLIPGRLTNAEAKEYAFYDWAPAGSFEYKLECIDIQGRLESYLSRSDSVNVDWDSGITRASCQANAFDGLASTIALNATAIPVEHTTAVGILPASMSKSGGAIAMQRLAQPVSVQEFSTNQISKAHQLSSVTIRAVSAGEGSVASASRAGVRWFSSARPGAAAANEAAKLIYSTPGVMLVPQSAMPAGYDISRVSVRREGRALAPLALTPRGLLLYGPGYSDDYTNKDALFLYRSSAQSAPSAPVSASGLFNSTQTPAVQTTASALREFHDVYFDYSYRPYVFPPWFSAQYLTAGSSQRFTLEAPGALNASAQLTVTLWSLTEDPDVAADHALQVLVNGVAVGGASWDGGNKMLSLKFDVPAGVLNTSNTVDLVTPDSGTPLPQISFLHSLRAEYSRALDASTPLELVNSSSATTLYEIQGVPAAGAWVVDTRFADRPALVPNETRPQAGGTLSLRFHAAPGGSGRYVIVPVGQEHAPLSINARRIQPLKLKGSYLATGPAKFQSAVQPLLLVRAREGIRSTFADQEQLFDYYNSGRFGPGGIQSAIRSTHPQYLLLLGRTHYDYLNYSGQNLDPLCPAFLIPTSFWAQTTSDAEFANLGRGLPEVAIGRLPVNNAAELSTAVQHIVSYRGVSASGVRAHVVADRADSAGDFAAQAETLAATTPELTWQRNYVGGTSPDATAAGLSMRDAANGGADVLVYVGHGNASRLGKDAPRILDVDTVQQWHGNVIFLQSTCTAHWMAKDEQDFKSIAIQALTQPQGGIAASIGSSTYMQSQCGAEFMTQVLRGASLPGARWGTALLRAQQWSMKQSGSAFYLDLGRSEQLFGDPAMRVFGTQTPAPAPSAGGSQTGTF